MSEEGRRAVALSTRYWLDLLLIPLLLAFGIWPLNRAAKEKERKTELDRSRDAALQTYLDRASALKESPWRESGEGFLDASSNADDLTSWLGGYINQIIS